MKKIDLVRFLVVVLSVVVSAAPVAAQDGQTPVDRTSYITNSSFESEATTGWTVNGMSRQSNHVFSVKKGTYYIETWVSIGQKIADVSVSQTLKNLPRGSYRLQAAALHIQQSGDGSTTNKGAAQTGAYLFAGNSKAAVTAMKTYAVTFAVFEEHGDVEIGLKAEHATGNYLCVDNFTLEYLGELSSDSYVQELQSLTAQGRSLLETGVQTAVAEKLSAAIAAAETALQGAGGDAAALANVLHQLQNAVKEAQASRAYYDALQERIDYAETVIGWWEGTSRNGLGSLKTYLQKARQAVGDFTLTNSQLTSTTNTLKNCIAAVDKKIYCSPNACGTDAELKNPASQWCYERSLQSKHWVLFWEAGYGAGVPASVKTILDTADKIFEFYADSLKFITINQGKSKSDTYKMTIRLRYTTEWEASGSGIDDMIGLLTLSNGAHTSRGGQTVAHEIGHCFQYQVHCDNNNQNGWMYNWGQSTLNVFWEMCAQWQAYKYYPAMQFDNEWLSNTLNGMHRHPLCVGLRYNNYFIQDFFCYKHGMDVIGRLWNNSVYPEDPLQAYMRLTMSGTAVQQLEQLNKEMWEYGARMVTMDMDHIRRQGSGSINKRSQTALVKDEAGYWSPTAANCIENFGNNAIRLNVPAGGKTVYAELVGEAGKAGYTAYNVSKAGWKFGFVAYLKDGTRRYGGIGSTTYATPDGLIAFDCPANCSALWLVVSGAPTSYWTRDWLSWESESTAEQWPYRVKFYQTNVYGKANNDTYPTAIHDRTADGRTAHGNVYTVSGWHVGCGSASLDGLPNGIYVVGGKKVIKK